MIEALFALLGTVIGFVLSEWATTRRENRNEKRQAQTVRALIGLEIERNLSLLRDFWSQLKTTPLPENDAAANKRRLAQRFVELPLPEWKQRVLDSQLSFLPLAIHEKEVTQVFLFYDRLSNLQACRAQLTVLSQDKTQQQRADRQTFRGEPMPISGYVPPKFDTNAPAIWDQCESIVAEIEAEGNPLRSSKL